MHIQDILSNNATTFSFEFFPPKTAESSEALYETIRELEAYQPHFVSVTYGAGGSTRELTHDLVVRIKQTASLDPIPHLTCVCHKEAEIAAILERYAEAGVEQHSRTRRRRPGSRGIQQGGRRFPARGESRQLHQEFLRASRPARIWYRRRRFPRGHPATPNRLLEMDYLKAKVDAGADYIVTQLFFDNRDFLDFRDRCELAGIRIPIIAGIMPITSTGGMRRMAELAAGARFPAKLLRALARCQDDPQSVARVGIHYASEQCHDLLEHKVSGIHFYTLNKSDATKQIFESLGLKHSRLAGAPGA